MSLLEMIRANPLEVHESAKGTIMRESQAAVAAVAPAPVAPAPTPAPVAPAPVAPIPARIVPAEPVIMSGTAFDGTRITADIVAGRIWLSFGQKPDRRTRETLKQNRFWYDGATYRWHQLDSQNARETLTREFGIRFDVRITTETPAPAPAAPTPAAPAPVNMARVAALDALPPDMERYKQQVDGLMLALNLSASELMIVAIQHLHDSTFPA